MTATPHGDGARRLEALRAERDRFVAFAFAAADMLIEAEGDGAIRFAAGAASALTGHAPEKLPGMALADLVAAHDRPILRRALSSLGDGGRIEAIRLRFRGAAGPDTPVDMTGYRLAELGGRFYLTFQVPGHGSGYGSGHGPDMSGAARDGTRASETALLTGPAFAEAASRRLTEARASGADLQLTLLDMNNLATLGRRLRHEARAELNAYIGASLRAASVAGDTAGEIKDDTFGLVHDRQIDIDAVVAEIKAYVAHLDPAGKGLSVETASVDVPPAALEDGDTAQVLLYTFARIKERGTEGLSLADVTGGLARMLTENAARVRSLRAVVRDKAFDLVFQPIVDLRSRRILHFESLVRFRAAGGRSAEVSPFETVYFADQVGQIGEFDLAMLGRVIDWYMESSASRLKFKVSVNISGSSLNAEPVLARVAFLLRGARQLKGRLGFEVTEYGKIIDLARVDRFVQDLRRAGHHVSLDDFGASEMTYRVLREIDVDAVKIDGRYVRESLGSPRDRAFLKAMAGLCDDLGVLSIGEMIEDEDTARLVASCGIAAGQGYLFGRPVADPSVFASQLAAPAKPAKPVREAAR